MVSTDISNLLDNLKTLLNKYYINKKKNHTQSANAVLVTDENGDAITVSTISASKISGLSTIATTGNYNDLNNEPTKLSQLTNDLTQHSTALMPLTDANELSIYDLNDTIYGIPGWYYCNSNDNAKLFSHTPWQEIPAVDTSQSKGYAFALEVIRTSNNYRTQILHPYSKDTKHNIYMRRGRPNNDWTDWIKIYNSDNLTKTDIINLGIADAEHNHDGVYVNNITSQVTNGTALADAKANNSVKGTIYHPKVLSSALSTEQLYKTTVNTDGHITKGTAITIDSSPANNANNLVSSQGVYNALAGKSDDGHNHNSTYAPISHNHGELKNDGEMTRCSNTQFTDTSVKGAVLLSSTSTQGKYEVKGKSTIPSSIITYGSSRIKLDKMLDGLYNLANSLGYQLESLEETLEEDTRTYHSITHLNNGFYKAPGFINTKFSSIFFTQLGKMIMVEYSLRSNGTIQHSDTYHNSDGYFVVNANPIPEEYRPVSSRKYQDIEGLGGHFRICIDTDGTVLIRGNVEINAYGSFVYFVDTKTYVSVTEANAMPDNP